MATAKGTIDIEVQVFMDRLVIRQASAIQWLVGYIEGQDEARRWTEPNHEPLSIPPSIVNVIHEVEELLNGQEIPPQG